MALILDPGSPSGDASRRYRIQELAPPGVNFYTYMGSDKYRQISIQGEEITYSSDNPFHQAKRYGLTGRFDYGGNFTSIKRLHVAPTPYSVNVRTSYGGKPLEWVGPVYARSGEVSASSILWPDNPTLSESALRGKGTSAIKIVMPTNPSVDLVTTLGELREGLPNLTASAVRKGIRDGHIIRGSADEYLNAEFGIKPLVSEVAAVANTAENYQKITSQYERDAGRLIRRRYDFPIVETEEVTETTGQAPQPYGSSLLIGSSTRTWRKITSTKTWFSGAFRYYLPPVHPGPLGGIHRNIAKSQRAFGTRIRAESVYNLLPWSWAVDWVSNLGDVISNISSFSSDGLVMPYGYIMSTTTITHIYRLAPCAYTARAGGGYTPWLEQRFVTVIKRRRKASPYGFHSEWADFTPRQSAILAALGISQTTRRW